MAERKRRGQVTWPVIWRISLAVVTVGLTVLLARLVPALLARGVLVMLLGAVAISTWLGGWRSSILAIVLSCLAAGWLVLPQHAADPRWENYLRLFIFISVAGLTVWLIESRQLARLKLLQAERKLSLAMEAAGMGAWEANLETGEFWWTPTMERIFGRPPGSFSQTYEDFIGYIHPDDRDFLERAITRMIEDGMDFEIEHRIVRPDQSIRWIITRGRIFYDSRGRAQSMTGVVADITERKKRQQAGEPSAAAGVP